MPNLDASYWNNRYNNNDISWDLGEVSPPIKAYIDQLTVKTIRILIPGGGNSYEAEYLYKNGFKKVFVADISKTALHNIKLRVSDFPVAQLLNKNVFELDMTFDLILEQTFFCAIDPKLREQYATKMHDLLSNDGRIVGVLFHIPLYTDRPPFGGNKQEYLRYFNPFFEIKRMQLCYNSIPERMGKELFINLIKT